MSILILYIGLATAVIIAGISSTQGALISQVLVHRHSCRLQSAGSPLLSVHVQENKNLIVMISHIIVKTLKVEGLDEFLIPDGGIAATPISLIKNQDNLKSRDLHLTSSGNV